MVDQAQLAAEIRTDPTGLGYAGPLAAGDTTTLASLINAPNPAIQIDRGVTPSYEILNATDPDDWVGLTTVERDRYAIITGAGNVDLRNANIRSSFQRMFGPGTTTRLNLLALLTRDGSRAEELFGTSVTATEIAVALNEVP